MGGAPSRETLARSILREPAAAAAARKAPPSSAAAPAVTSPASLPQSTAGGADCSEATTGSAKTNSAGNATGTSSSATAAAVAASKQPLEMVLIPLIPEYFPNSASPLFQQLVAVCREANVQYYHRDARSAERSDRTVSRNLGSDKEMYNRFMSLSEQRMVETDSDLIALHRAGRVFSPVPCAVAFVYDASNVVTAAAAAAAAQVASGEVDGEGGGGAGGKQGRGKGKRGGKKVHGGVGSVVPGNGFMTIENTVRLPQQSIRVRIFGFVGDTNPSAPSMVRSQALKHPLGFSLFLSKSAGGNHRAQVTLLAAYTYVTQLKQIGIINDFDLAQRGSRKGSPLPGATSQWPGARLPMEDEMAYGQYDSSNDPYATEDVGGLDGSGNGAASAAASRRPGGDGPLPVPLGGVMGMFGTTPPSTSGGGHHQDSAVILRRVEFLMHRTDVPALCFLRELRARMAEGYAQSTTKRSPHDDPMSPPLPPLTTTVNPNVIQTVVETEVLKGTLSPEDAELTLEWAAEFYVRSLDRLTGGEAAKLRQELAQRNLEENVLNGEFFITPNLPTSTGKTTLHKGDAWVTPHDTFIPTNDDCQWRVDDAVSQLDWEPVTAGTVLRYDGAAWRVQPNEHAEDLLLSLCRRACVDSRRAPPYDPHWVMDANNQLPEGIQLGFLIWCEECAGQTVYYGTTPDFLKKWNQSGADAAAMYLAEKPAPVVEAAAATTASNAMEASLDVSGRRSGVSPSASYGHHNGGSQHGSTPGGGGGGTAGAAATAGGGSSALHRSNPSSASNSLPQQLSGGGPTPPKTSMYSVRTGFVTTPEDEEEAAKEELLRQEPSPLQMMRMSGNSNTNANGTAAAGVTAMTSRTSASSPPPLSSSQPASSSVSSTHSQPYTTSPGGQQPAPFVLGEGNAAAPAQPNANAAAPLSSTASRGEGRDGNGGRSGGQGMFPSRPVNVAAPHQQQPRTEKIALASTAAAAGVSNTNTGEQQGQQQQFVVRSYSESANRGLAASFGGSSTGSRTVVTSSSLTACWIGPAHAFEGGTPPVHVSIAVRRRPDGLSSSQLGLGSGRALADMAFSTSGHATPTGRGLAQQGGMPSSKPAIGSSTTAAPSSRAPQPPPTPPMPTPSSTSSPPAAAGGRQGGTASSAMRPVNAAAASPMGSVPITISTAGSSSEDGILGMGGHSPKSVQRSTSLLLSSGLAQYPGSRSSVRGGGLGAGVMPLAGGGGSVPRYAAMHQGQPATPGSSITVTRTNATGGVGLVSQPQLTSAVRGLHSGGMDTTTSIGSAASPHSAMMSSSSTTVERSAPIATGKPSGGGMYPSQPYLTDHHSSSSLGIAAAHRGSMSASFAQPQQQQQRGSVSNGYASLGGGSQSLTFSTALLQDGLGGEGQESYSGLGGMAGSLRRQPTPLGSSFTSGGNGTGGGTQLSFSYTATNTTRTVGGGTAMSAAAASASPSAVRGLGSSATATQQTSAAVPVGSAGSPHALSAEPQQQQYPQPGSLTSPASSLSSATSSMRRKELKRPPRLFGLDPIDTTTTTPSPSTAAQWSAPSLVTPPPSSMQVASSHHQPQQPVYSQSASASSSLSSAVKPMTQPNHYGSERNSTVRSEAMPVPERHHQQKGRMGEYHNGNNGEGAVPDSPASSEGGGGDDGQGVRARSAAGPGKYRWDWRASPVVNSPFSTSQGHHPPL